MPTIQARDYYRAEVIVMGHKSRSNQALLGTIKPMMLIIVAGLLCACGGGSNSTANNLTWLTSSIADIGSSTSISQQGAVTAADNTVALGSVISGGGVKGPLAFAKVTLYSLDTSQSRFYDPQSPVATASTDANAEIVGLQIPDNVQPPFVMVMDGTNATDLNTGTTPVITTLITVVSQNMLNAGRPIYATPLTTMAFYMARLEAGIGASTTAVTDDLVKASQQIISTIGFGMSSTIDIFSTPPVINSYTTTVEDQQIVAEYRAAIEALSAMFYEMAQSEGDGLKAEYFNNMDFTNPALTRTDSTVNFDWGSGVPAPGMASDGFSIRWSGQIEPAYTETYTFYTNSDDGIRLWINDQLLIDDWTDHVAKEDSATLAMVAGQKYTIKIEYHENTGLALAELLWSSPSQPKEIVPQSRLFTGSNITAADLAQKTNGLLEHLAYDLQSDGIINGSAGGVALDDINTAILQLNPATLMIPNSNIQVGDIVALLKNELVLTNTTTPFYEQDIAINLQPAVLDPANSSGTSVATNTSTSSVGGTSNTTTTPVITTTVDSTTSTTSGTSTGSTSGTSTTPVTTTTVDSTTSTTSSTSSGSTSSTSTTPVVSTAPILSLSSNAIDFGSINLGSVSDAQIVTITNMGSAPAIIGSITTSGDFSQNNDCNNYLDVNAVCSVNIKFTPTSTGAISGQLTISDNDNNSPHIIGLSGVGNALIQSTTLTPSGPIVIDGQSNITISGVHVTNPNGTCITIKNGATNIVIENSEIGPCGLGSDPGYTGLGVMIMGGNPSASNVTIRNNYIHDTWHHGVWSYQADHITVDHNVFINVWSAFEGWTTTAGNISFTNNWVKNLAPGGDGSITGPRGSANVAQLVYVHGPNLRITDNIAVNVPGESHPEDLVNLYQSGGTASDPILVARNNFMGGGPSNSGFGILMGDGGTDALRSSYTTAEDNILINTGSGGLNIAGGHDNIARNNKIYSDVKDADYPNVGMGVGGDCSTDIIEYNDVTFYKGAYNQFNIGGVAYLYPFYSASGCTGITGLSTNKFDTPTAQPANLDMSIWKSEWNTPSFLPDNPYYYSNTQ